MPHLTTEEIHHHLKSLPNWSLKDKQLARTFEFTTFPEGIRFVDQVALLAESANHHPDIDIRYTKITLHLTSHDAGGITKKDFALAAEIDPLYP